MRIMVTGGCGFIGSALVRHLKAHSDDSVVVLDALTYAGNPANLEGTGAPIVRADIADAAAVRRALREHRPDAIVHLAAETHVDRSIYDPLTHIRTNALGAATLIEAARDIGVEWFLHVSTDEVTGALGPDDPPVNEESPLRPSSPYAASKAAGEMLARAAHRTYGFPVIVARPSNCYGPRQYPEKFIPHAILRAMAGEAIPIYGDGRQMREWLHVEDCARALDLLLRRGRVGETYCVGSGERAANVSVAGDIVRAVGTGNPEHVADRAGHDWRYAVDSAKMHRETGWRPRHLFADGMRATVAWYQEHRAWWEPLLSGDYRRWVAANYERRGAP